MGGQSGIAELPESLAGIQEVTVQVSRVEGGGKRRHGSALRAGTERRQGDRPHH